MIGLAMRSRWTVGLPRVWLVEARGVVSGVVFAGVEAFGFEDDRNTFLNKSAIWIYFRPLRKGPSAISDPLYRTRALHGFRSHLDSFEWAI
jgi:hypothetical protein